MADSDSIKLCECGCGQPASISPVSHAARGYIKGQPRRFVSGHQPRVQRVDVCLRGHAMNDANTRITSAGKHVCKTCCRIRTKLRRDSTPIPATRALCECGCGQPTSISKSDVPRLGVARGQPFRFIRGHHAKGANHHLYRHGYAVTTKPPSGTYQSWQDMNKRCSNPRASFYHRYGGRGIKVCDRWRHSFENFLADMGERPAGMTLDRYPNSDGNYEPGNTRWATPTEQMNNRGNFNVSVTAFGKTMTVAEWSRETGLKAATITGRIRKGWDAERALTVPV